MLVTMKEILDRASKEMYAVAAPNVVSEIDTRAFIEAAEELRSPLILDVAADANSDMNYLGKICRELAEQSNVPIAINLDHGGPFEDLVDAVRSGFTSIMIDRSVLPIEENIRDTKEIVKIAHAAGMSVEAELGHVGDADNYEVDRDAALTSPEDALRFIEETGVDCLAVAIGTAHGAYPEGFVPYLDFDRLAEIKKATGNFPLVLHGSSGTRHEDLRKVCSMGINKVNINSDLNKACWDALDEARKNGASTYDFFVVIHDACKSKLIEMMKIYGSEGKAWVPENKGLVSKQLNMREG